MCPDIRIQFVEVRLGASTTWKPIPVATIQTFLDDRSPAPDSQRLDRNNTVPCARAQHFPSITLLNMIKVPPRKPDPAGQGCPCRYSQLPTLAQRRGLQSKSESPQFIRAIVTLSAKTHCLPKSSISHPKTIVKDPNPRTISIEMCINPDVAR